MRTLHEGSSECALQSTGGWGDDLHDGPSDFLVQSTGEGFEVQAGSLGFVLQSTEGGVGFGGGGVGVQGRTAHSISGGGTVLVYWKP